MDFGCLMISRLILRCSRCLSLQTLSFVDFVDFGLKNWSGFESNQYWVSCVGDFGMSQC